MKYNTTDLGLAAYLIVKGFKLYGIENTGKKKTFVFENNEDLKNEEEKYWNNETTCSSLQYFNELKNLKSRINNLYE